MLFDLQSGRRRNVVRVVYGTLAALFLFGFVLFGIGGDVTLDPAQLFGGSDDANPTTQFDAQVDEAQQRLAQNPDNPDALLDAARYGYLAGNTVADQDESTGIPVANEDARSYWNPALDAWERYVRTDPKEVDVTVAAQMVLVYQLLGDFSGAARTQALYAEQDPNPETYGTLAYLQYVAGDIAAGDEAADKAVAQAEGKDAKELERRLGNLSEQARKAKQQAAQGTGEEPQIQSPFGGLGGFGGALPPASP
jgi:hypothetical protein